MLSAVAIIPSAPVLVPELAGSAAGEVADLRSAVDTAVAVLPTRWIAVGIGAADAELGPQVCGTFAGFGVDVRVRLGPEAGAPNPVELPLCGLMAAWVRGRAGDDRSVQARVYAADLGGDTARSRGRELRASIDREPEPIGVLVVADGVNTLTLDAPGGYDPDGTHAQQFLDEALAGGDVGALTRLPARVLGRAAFAVLAGLTEPGPQSAKELYRGAPFGVGYFVGVWQP
ncbi:hypothetical protein [Mycobacterium sp.]|uniref:hypothetical protein n=1 Tax=Mycobacterium sp. TaxID=1785 RepID=UPI003A8B6142